MSVPRAREFDEDGRLDLQTTLERAQREAWRVDPGALWRRFGHSLAEEAGFFWGEMGHAGARWRADETVAWVVHEVSKERTAQLARIEAEAAEWAAASAARTTAERARSAAVEDARWKRPGLKTDPDFRAAITDHQITAAFHWTPLRFLESVLRLGVRPRAYLDVHGVPYELHSYGAREKTLQFANHVAVSIYPQRGMMWRASDPVLLGLDNTVLAQAGAFYVPGNTAAAKYAFRSVSRLIDAADFHAIFTGPGSPELIDWQAEIWVPEGIPAHMVRSISVADEPARDVATAVVQASGATTVDVVLDPALSGRLDAVIPLDLLETPPDDVLDLPF